MNTTRLLLPTVAAALAAACASPQAPALAAADPHAAHGAASTAASPATGMALRMKSMQAMHDKMRAAKTLVERQALMADHMRAMRDGMAMMKEMDAMPSMDGAPGASVGKGMADGMAKHHQRMTEHNAAMHLMMEMMLDHLPSAPPVK